LTRRRSSAPVNLAPAPDQTRCHPTDDIVAGASLRESSRTRRRALRPLARNIRSTWAKNGSRNSLRRGTKAPVRSLSDNRELECERAGASGGKDRSAPRQAQPLIFQGAGCLARCSRRRHRHHPNYAADFVLMFAKNLAQAPAVAIADDDPSDAARSNEAGANERFWFGIFQNAECKRSATDGGSFRPNALEFGIQSESAR